MFTRKEHFIKKTGPNGVGRYQFLSLLVQEFKKSTSIDAQRQVLANLVNFSYDPINYQFLRQLGVIDLFLTQLSGSNQDFVEFALAGICNLSSDSINQKYIIEGNGIFLASQWLLHESVEISLNALTILIFLITPDSQVHITKPDIIIKALHYQTSPNSRLKNLGTIFLEDYCTTEQIDYAKSAATLSTPDIPLPS